jgi:ABC-2 type transport system ATP-binding protein
VSAAIEIAGVSKHFRIYHERNSTLKAAILRGRRASYEEFLALEDVTFDVPEGSTFGLIGENGSGKSTLLKCLARILVPDAGTLQLNGSMSALLELGAGFHGELSGRENVYLNGSILGMSKKEIDARFDDIVEFAGGDVPRFIDNPVKNYSSGMFVRLGFSIAINVEPDILLVDEILAVGDEDFQRKCMQKFAELHKGGRTVVVVSHALDTVRNLCDHAAWLEHGVLREVGPAGQVVDAYLDAVTDQRRVRKPAPTTARIAGGEIIRDVQILDEHGEPTTVLKTGERATIRVGLECGTTGDTEILHLEIHQADGTCIARATTRDTGVDIHDMRGYQVVDYELERVLLAPKEYDLSLRLFAKDGRQELERLRNVAHFEVAPGALKHRGGLVMLGGEWSVEPAFATSDLTG